MHTISCSYRAHSLKQFRTKREKFPPSRIMFCLISHVSKRLTVVIACLVLLRIHFPPWPSNFEVMINTLEGHITLGCLNVLNGVEGFQIPFNPAVFTEELHSNLLAAFLLFRQKTQSSSGMCAYRIRVTPPWPWTISSMVESDSSHRTALHSLFFLQRHT